LVSDDGNVLFRIAAEDVSASGAQAGENFESKTNLKKGRLK
jgi:hypothetical protein